ncbi:MAG: OmpA family protein [Lentisphaerae bacterium]|nr:OmpA family protein [Lentisphaerota bacterium]
MSKLLRELSESPGKSSRGRRASAADPNQLEMDFSAPAPPASPPEPAVLRPGASQQQVVARPEPDPAKIPDVRSAPVAVESAMPSVPERVPACPAADGRAGPSVRQPTDQPTDSTASQERVVSRFPTAQPRVAPAKPAAGLQRGADLRPRSAIALRNGESAIGLPNVPSRGWRASYGLGLLLLLIAAGLLSLAFWFRPRSATALRHGEQTSPDSVPSPLLDVSPRSDRGQRLSRQRQDPSRETPTLPPPALNVSPVDLRSSREPPRAPEIRVDGVRVLPTAKGLTLIFSEGVFSRRAEIAQAAQPVLLNLAKQLRELPAGHRIEIEGHTDSDPVRAGGPVDDNQALGYRRAETVRDFLEEKGGLPALAMTVTSAGESNPPYPNTTPESRRKNRTVVLKLLPVKP